MTYTPGIPQANQIVSLTQPLIANNFTSNQNAFDVNHVDFNTSGAGKHKFVEMPAITIQTPPIADPVPGSGEANLYVKAVASIPELWIYRAGQIPLQMTSGVVFDTPPNGSVGLIGGIIIKWGSGSSTGSNTGDIINFAGGAFPTNCFSVVATSKDIANGNAADTYVYARSFSTGSFNLLSVHRISLNPVASTYSYIAIGN